MITELTEPLKALDWNDTPSVEEATTKILNAFADDRALLRRVVRAVPGDEHLCELAEHYDILDKLVLHDDPAGWRLRLHIFLPGYFDRPHNHRWTYSSRILRGSYQHTLYGLDDTLDEDTDVAGLQPYLVRTEATGDGYTLHHRMIHAAVAEPHTVSPIVRGPAMKDRFFVADRVTGKAWWQFGAAKETTEQAAKKRMTAAQIDKILRALADFQLI
ncbi:MULTISPECIES: hypothetical protein [Streptomyces]|uniref:hypothetical protein n=1 Tax=Streptomyces TaxID=1883 RepID=UPI00345BF48E